MAQGGAVETQFEIPPIDHESGLETGSRIQDGVDRFGKRRRYPNREDVVLLGSLGGEIDGPAEGADRRFSGRAGHGTNLVSAAIGIGGDALALADKGGMEAALFEPVLVVGIADDIAVEAVDTIEIGLASTVEEIGRDIAAIHQPREYVADARRFGMRDRQLIDRRQGSETMAEQQALRHPLGGNDGEELAGSGPFAVDQHPLDEGVARAAASVLWQHPHLGDHALA